MICCIIYIGKSFQKTWHDVLSCVCQHKPLHMNFLSTDFTSRTASHQNVSVNEYARYDLLVKLLSHRLHLYRLPWCTSFICFFIQYDSQKMSSNIMNRWMTYRCSACFQNDCAFPQHWSKKDFSTNWIQCRFLVCHSELSHGF